MWRAARLLEEDLKRPLSFPDVPCASSLLEEPSARLKAGEGPALRRFANDAQTNARLLHPRLHWDAGLQHAHHALTIAGRRNLALC